MEENLLSTPSQSKKQIGFLSQIWICMKLQFRIRKTSLIFKSFDFYFSLLTFSLLLFNLIYMQPIESEEINTYTSETDTRTLSDFLTSTYEIYFYPNNEKSHEFSRYYIPENFSYLIKFINTTKEYNELINKYENSSTIIDRNVFIFSIENHSKTSQKEDTIVRIYSRYDQIHIYPDIFFDVNILNTAFTDLSIPSNQSFNFDYIQYTMNETENETEISYSEGFMTTLSYHLGVSLLLFTHIFYITYLINKKGFFIINASGVPEKAIWISSICVETVYILIISIIFTLTYLIHPEHSITDLFTIFIFVFYMGFTFMISLMTFVPLFLHITIIVVFFCLVEAFVLVDMVLGAYSNEFFLIKYDCYFLPLGNLIHFAILLMKGNSDGIQIHLWDSTSVSTRFTLQDLFLNLTYQLIVYSLIFIFNILFVPRKYGKPKIGFKNIFNLRYWKNLFIISHNIKSFTSYPFIEVSNLSKTYKNSSYSIKAIDQVEFSIDKGDSIVIIGPNGSGKSTLLQMLTGSLVPDDYTLRLFGQKGDFTDLTSSLGFCSQDNIFFPTLTVYEHLAFFGKLRGLNDKQLLKREINLIAEMLQLDRFLNQRADRLSGGISRLLLTANAYIGSPSLVILDEPTAGLDVNNRQLIWRCTTLFQNTTSIISSHSLEEAENVATKFFILNKGHIIFKGTSTELRNNYGTGYRLSPVFSDKNIDDDKLVEILNSIYNFVKEIIPNAKIDNERYNCILVPVSDKMADLMEKLYDKLNDFQCIAFNISVEALEDSLLRLVIDYDDF